jgi:hypothetical protein
MFILRLLAYLPFVIVLTSDIGKKVIATQKLKTLAVVKSNLQPFFYMPCGNLVYSVFGALRTSR